jgi:hypothetical protein
MPAAPVPPPSTTRSWDAATPTFWMSRTTRFWGAAIHAFWMTRHTFSALAGLSMNSTPTNRNASATAFITAGGAAVMPASLMPLTPSGLVDDGVTVRSRMKPGSSAADGTR